MRVGEGAQRWEQWEGKKEELQAHREAPMEGNKVKERALNILLQPPHAQETSVLKEKTPIMASSSDIIPRDCF